MRALLVSRLLTAHASQYGSPSPPTLVQKLFFQELVVFIFSGGGTRNGPAEAPV